MNREIKFRAWHKVDGFNKMYYLNAFVPYGEGWHGGNPVYKFYELYFGLKGMMKVHVADIEIMQYTGLKDKNGKEIYEGDIIEWTLVFKSDFGNTDKIDKSQYEVVFEMNNIMDIVGFYFKDKNGKYTHFRNFKDVEVIGNIGNF